MSSTDNNEKLSPSAKVSSVFYVEFGVVIVAESIDPNSINELLLRHHSVINDADEVSQDPILTPVFAQIGFNNGITITCDGTRLLVVQKVKSADAEGNRCPEIALKYLGYAAIPKITAIGINFKSVLQGREMRVSQFFRRDAEWAKFGSVVPDVQFKAIYRDGDRRINLDVGRAVKRDEPEFEGILRAGNIHRDINTDTQKVGIAPVIQIIDDWHSDLDDFNEIITRLQELKDD